MYKKRLKKWNIRKRSYRTGQQPTTTSPSVVTALDADSSSDVVVAKKVPRPPEAGASALTLVRPSSPEPFACLEMVLGSVLSWTVSKLESPHHEKLDPMSRYLARPNQPPIQDSRTMYRTFELVFDLWRYGNGNLAGMAARKGFYVLEYVLTDDHPDLIWHILDTIYDMVDTGHLQLLALFLNHASVIAHRHLPGQHPLQRILRQLTKCDYQTSKGRQFVCHLLRQAWLRNVDMLSQRIRSLAPRDLWLYEQLIWDARTRLRRSSDLGRRSDVMKAALEMLAEHQPNRISGPGCESLRVEALMLEFTQMDLGDKKTAEELAWRLLRDTENPDQPARSAARFNAYARKMLARLYEERCEWDLAEQNLQWAINKREAAHGTNNNLRVVRDMWVLAAHYWRTGRPDEAARVAQDAASRATLYLNDLPG